MCGVRVWCLFLTPELIEQIIIYAERCNRRPQLLLLFALFRHQLATGYTQKNEKNENLIFERFKICSLCHRVVVAYRPAFFSNGGLRRKQESVRPIPTPEHVRLFLLHFFFFFVNALLLSPSPPSLTPSLFSRVKNWHGSSRFSVLRLPGYLSYYTRHHVPSSVEKQSRCLFRVCAPR